MLELIAPGLPLLIIAVRWLVWRWNMRAWHAPASWWRVWYVKCMSGQVIAAVLLGAAIVFMQQEQLTGALALLAASVALFVMRRGNSDTASALEWSARAYRKQYGDQVLVVPEDWERNRP